MWELVIASRSWPYGNAKKYISDHNPSVSDMRRATEMVTKEQERGLTTRIPRDSLDQEIYLVAQIFRWKSLQHGRLRFLLLNNLLAGEALEAGLKLKRTYEKEEWRKW
jgi:hypothetical protein